MWDVFVFNHLHSKNIAVPPRTKKMAGEFEGAYVKDVKPGIYGWGISTDFASLYPTIIQQWNLSPETLVTEHHLSLTVDEVVKGKLTDYFSETAHLGNYTIAANGSMYRKDKKGIIPELMDFLSSARKIAKKEMLKLEKEYQETHNEALLPKIAALNSRQLALKVGGNSGYGALTNSGFRYFDLRIGEAITLTGQAADKFAEKKINEYLNKTLKTENFDYVIYCDTDSAYTNLQPLVDKICSNKSDEEKTKFLEKVGKAIQDGPIKESIDEMYELCNCYTKLMDMKLESVFSRAIWTAKKRYAMKVHSSEGVTYNPPKIKITGLDMIKSSTPKQIRSLLKDTLPIIFEGGEDALRQYVIETKSKFMIMNPEDIAFPRSASEIGKWTDGNTYRSGTPIHVRGCILYNQLIKGLIGFSTGISDKYDILMDGDKVKFIYLKLPNPIRENVISFPSTGKIPHELQFEQYVDYELQFEKTFIAPLKGITDAIGWSLEEKTSLEDFFG
jgi:DNA polymerase elongation subunit (family B)